MALFQTLFILSLAVSAALTAGIGIYTFRRRDVPGAKGLTALMATITWWTALYAILIVGVIPPSPLFWFSIMYFGVVVVPPAFLLFTFQFVGYAHWITPRLLGLLSIEPIVVMILIWTEPYRSLLRGAFRVELIGPASLGPGFQLHSAYSYVLVAACCVLLVWRAFHAPPFYRRQVALLFVGTLAVVGLNFFSITYLVPRYHVDVTWLGFIILGMLMAYALSGQGLLELLPVARHRVVEAMQDGVLVIDDQNRVVDINPAAYRMLRPGPSIEPGVSVLTVFSAWRALLPQHTARVAFNREIRLEGGEAKYIDVQATPLQDRRHASDGWIVVLRDITRIKTVQDELRAQLAHNEELQKILKAQAMRDSLTGLYNRRFFEETLRREMAHAERDGTVLVLCMLDIDRFKTINDSRGHVAGDNVLKALAELLKSQTRPSDVVCRYGGEEFVVLMPRTPLDMGLARANVLRERFHALQTDGGGGPGIRASFSAGVACYPQHGANADDVLAAADRALYEAKDAGRNCVLSAAVSHLQALAQ